jgi:3-oxoacyl-[acyl-carrier protein] reductase
MDKLAGKVALVTGAGRGMGPVIATRLAEDGATVVVNYGRSAAGAEEVVKGIVAKGGNAVAMKADIRQRAEIVQMFAQIDREFGRIDIVVNNAGTGGRMPLTDLKEKVVENILGVNFRGPLYIAGEAAKRMQSGGRIVNISSSVVDFPFQDSSVYTASKAAVKAFTTTWAKELGAKGITVNTVTPGATSPGMVDGSPEFRAFFEKASPFGRVGRADEIAAVISFLCSPEASWVSGTDILVNGAGNA